MSERKRSIIAWTVTGIVIAAGAVVLRAGLLTPVTCGWFAYPLLGDATFVPGASGVFLSRITIIGWVILTGGLLAAAFLVGPRTAHGRPNWSNTGSAI